jgi:2,3-bisphosphoglycerate-independent phosphoglycerate mutase
MDGWGEAQAGPANAISIAKTPFVDSLYEKYPHSQLLTSGTDVGLPDGQMGNSEVGHLNIGAGRVVLQELLRINKAISDGSFDNNECIINTLNYCLQNDKPLHLFGLLSDGGVHSHQDHLIHICNLAKKHQIKKVFIHAFTDGRDTDPSSGIESISILESAITGTNSKIATIIGRYYAMDRDKRWERIKLAYDLLVNSKGEYFENSESAIRHSYENGVTDEFIKPIVIAENGNPVGSINEGDAVLCFNFRTDRCREITHVLTQADMEDHSMKKLDLYYTTLTRYDSTFQNVNVVFDKPNVKNTLGEVLSSEGKTQLRIAETEKYPHVTFFFSGGREDQFSGEKRIMVPSPKVATYDMQPTMSAFEVKDELLKMLAGDDLDFVCLNFANPDMVGHTGNIEAAAIALETVDKCVAEIVEIGLRSDYSFLITSDHGNADKMMNPDGSPNTAHTTNPVPLILIAPDSSQIELNNGRLADIAPTILELMGLKIPAEMNGKVLLKKR